MNRRSTASQNIPAGAGGRTGVRPDLFKLTQPCDQCPFTRGPNAVRLTTGRVHEICASFLTEPGSMFPCHKTVDVDDSEEWDGTDLQWQMCAGGLILAEKVRPAKPVRMIQLAERMLGYDARALTGRERVFESKADMLRTAIRHR